MEEEGEQLCVCVCACVCIRMYKMLMSKNYFELTVNSLMSKLTVDNYSLAGFFDSKNVFSYLLYKTQISSADGHCWVLINSKQC